MYFAWSPMYCTFMLTSHWILLKMINISDKICTENQNTFPVQELFFPNIVPLTKYCGKKMVQLDRPPIAVRWMCFACWITKATYAHSEYVILIAFSRQKLLQERDSVLRYTYISFFVLKFLIDYRMSLSLLRCIIICYYIFKILLFVFVLWFDLREMQLSENHILVPSRYNL